MHSLAFLITTTLLASISCLAQCTSNSSYVQATAIVRTAKNISAFECWQFLDPVTIDNNKGTSGAKIFAFPNTTQTRYSVFPPRYAIGTNISHNPPAVQLVTQLSGLAHVTLPVPIHGNKTLDEAWIKGGAYGMFLATDPQGAGHITEWPSDEYTVTLQIPFASIDDIPPYKVLGPGPCSFHRVGSQLVS